MSFDPRWCFNTSYVSSAIWANIFVCSRLLSGAASGNDVGAKACGKGNTGRVFCSSRIAASHSNSSGNRRGQSSPWLCNGKGSTCTWVSMGFLNSLPPLSPVQVAMPPTPCITSIAAIKSGRLRSASLSATSERGGISNNSAAGSSACSGTADSAAPAASSAGSASSSNTGSSSPSFPSAARLAAAAAFASAAAAAAASTAATRAASASAAAAAAFAALASAACNTNHSGTKASCFLHNGRGCKYTPWEPVSWPRTHTFKLLSTSAGRPSPKVSRLVACSAAAEDEIHTSKDAPRDTIRRRSSKVWTVIRPAPVAATQAASHFSANGGPCCSRNCFIRTCLRLSAAICLKTGSDIDGGSRMPNFSMQTFWTKSELPPMSSPSCVHTSGPAKSSE
mmetsp:Transcript_56278/g.163147  ORF Transcript_56278/g.163147 Transcript_56278/m.163147 type:complete len:394 (-) Transcript_56278:323-1504(-)